MDTADNERINGGEKYPAGISMSDGSTVYKDTKDLYLDELYNTEEDNREIEKVKKNIMTKRDKRVISLLWVLNAAVFAFLGIYLALSGSADEYEPIKEEARFEAEEGYQGYYDSTEIFADTLAPKYSETEYPEGIIEGLKPLYSENSDTVGWLRIEGMNVDHVLLQTENNDDYLRTTFHGDYYVGGSIFMDYRNKVSKKRGGLSKNTILYGHYLMNQRGMFSDLDKYMDVEYYKEHPVIELTTLYNSYQWKIIGCFLGAINEEDDNGLFYFWYDKFSDENTMGFANEVAFRSYFINPAVDVQPTDKFLTLSTCSHLLDIGGMVNARCVIVARLVRDGESAEVDVSQAYKNTNQRMPQLWYDLKGIENPYAHYAIWDAYA
ncbi:MAG: class B sortase [Ruminococcaceae bacterium]|nr:class B sortase [Oscillospiraceae bacterium]MBR3596138.1 class B sortase [Clostridia bacterium]